MYCVFCGKADVTSCPRCGRWVCPRHQRPWAGGVVCIGCRRRLMQVRAGQIAVVLVAIGVIGLTITWLVNR
jgi:hypothetical protein